MSETVEFAPRVGDPVLWAPGGTVHVYLAPAQEEGYTRVMRPDPTMRDKLIEGTVRTDELAPARGEGEWLIFMTDEGYDADHWRTLGSYELMIHSRHQGNRVHPFGVYLVGSSGEGRREYQGPIVKGPYASLVAHATVISAHPTEPQMRIDIAHGTVLVLATPEETLRFRVEEGRPGQNPALVPV